MNRRKFLDSTLKTISAASCAPLYTNALDAFVPQQAPVTQPRSSNAPRPQLAITMDDPRLKLESNLRWQDANSRILKALDSRNVKAALFVCGMRVDEYDGSKLISAWDQAGHQICNHS
jgi:Polysaccharide deacetylase